MAPELAAEIRRYPAAIDYELAKILGHSNIKTTERYAKLGRARITKTGNTAKVIWNMLDKEPEQEEGEQPRIA